MPATASGDGFELPWHKHMVEEIELEYLPRILRTLLQHGPEKFLYSLYILHRKVCKKLRSLFF